MAIKISVPCVAQVGVHRTHQQLWAQLALLGVSGADQDEAGGVANRYALTLHGVPAWDKKAHNVVTC